MRFLGRKRENFFEVSATARINSRSPFDKFRARLSGDDTQKCNSKNNGKCAVEAGGLCG
jgi:hypothetical protein